MAFRHAWKRVRKGYGNSSGLASHGQHPQNADSAPAVTKLSSSCGRGQSQAAAMKARVLIAAVTFGVAVHGHWFDNRYVATAVHIIRLLVSHPHSIAPPDAPERINTRAGGLARESFGLRPAD